MSSQLWSMRGSLCLIVGARARLTSVLVASSSITPRRAFATEPSPEDYGYYPDPLEHATGLEKKMLIARLRGDDRYEPKIYYRAEQSTKDDPNLVPTHFNDRMMGCMCEPDSTYVNYMWLRKGVPKRCECGHWFKAIDADPDSF